MNESFRMTFVCSLRLLTFEKVVFCGINRIRFFLHEMNIFRVNFLLRTSYNTISALQTDNVIRMLFSSYAPGPKESLLEHQKKIMSRGLPKKKSIDGVKNIILVVSGKGGVGKSTSSVNIAVALSEMKKMKVGLLDADVFGPSVPLMMGVNESPALTDDNKMIPLESFGVKCMSMGFLVTETSAVIWRGLMVMSALERLIRQVAWLDIDCLVVDTPPGTGDTLLSLIQNLPIAGVVMVTTPQKAAVQIARRGATMLQKLSVPIIGLIENMSNVECPKCNTNITLFGEMYTKELIKELDIPLLARVPLESSISISSDAGIPVVLSHPKSLLAEQYRKVADEITAFLSSH